MFKIARFEKEGSLMYVIVFHQFSICCRGGLGARGAALFGVGGGLRGVGATWLVGWATVASWTCGAEAVGASTSLAAATTTTGGGFLLRILIALTKSRAATMQTLDLGKATRIAPSNVSSARRIAKVMVESFSHPLHCSRGGHCCCCCCCCQWCWDTSPHAPFFIKVATATTSVALPKGRPKEEVSPLSSDEISRIWKINNIKLKQKITCDSFRILFSVDLFYNE